MWGFLILLILICLAVPPIILGAAIAIHRLCIKLNPPFRLIAQTIIVSSFGCIFLLSVAIPLVIAFAPWLVQQPKVQELTHYDPKKTFQQNLHRITDEFVPYESSR